MAAAVAPSRPVTPAPVCGASRVRVIDPTCVAGREDQLKGKQVQDASGCRRPRDEVPRRTPRPQPSVMRRRRRRDGDRGASPDRKRRTRGSERAGRAVYSRKNDDDVAHRRDRDVAHRAAKRKEGRRERGRARGDTRRRSTSRSGEQRAPREYPSAADDRKRSPEEETEKAGDDAEDEAARRRQDELQRQREEFRRELDKVVRTVWFNDPYISPLCVFNTMPRWSLRTSSEVEEGEVV